MKNFFKQISAAAKVAAELGKEFIGGDEAINEIKKDAKGLLKTGAEQLKKNAGQVTEDLEEKVNTVVAVAKTVVAGAFDKAEQFVDSALGEKTEAAPAAEQKTAAPAAKTVTVIVSTTDEAAAQPTGKLTKTAGKAKKSLNTAAKKPAAKAAKKAPAMKAATPKKKKG